MASAARPFFDGLLPEGVVRSSLAHSLRVSEEDGFALLEALGVDCAGAVVVLPAGEEPRASGGEIRPLTDADLAQLIEELPEHPLGVDGRATGVRLSLGGIQEKLVLVRSPAREYGQPLGGAPSTCILKPEHGDYPAIVQLLRDSGSPRAAADIVKVIEAALLNFLIGNSDAHAEALVATAKAEGWHRPVVDRVFTLIGDRARQLSA